MSSLFDKLNLRPQEWRLVVAPLMLILLMITRPQGILGTREISWSWLRGRFARPRPAREAR